MTITTERYINVGIAFASFVDGEEVGNLSIDNISPPNRYRWSGTAWELIEIGLAAITEPRALAGERNAGTANNYAAVVPECDYAVVDLSDNSTTVTANPALLFGIYVDTVLSAHACPLKDDTGTVLSLVASLAAGSMLEFPGVKFNTSLVIDPDDAATGKIVVFYREQ